MSIVNYRLIMRNHETSAIRATQHIDNYDILTLQDIALACLKDKVYSIAEIQKNGQSIWIAKITNFSNLSVKEAYIENEQYNLERSVASGKNRK